MCGRYELDAIRKDLWERYKLAEVEGDFSPREEIFPTNICPIIIPGPAITDLKWGFMESFTKKPLINARQETILEKHTFSQAFIQSRCVIPATAFFEWEKNGSTKTKRRVSVKGLPIFSMAGIRKIHPQADGSFIETFAIITTDATESLVHVHKRMPVILRPEEEAYYLDHAVPASEVTALLTTEHQRAFEFKID